MIDTTTTTKDDERDIRLMSHEQMINNNISNIIKLSESDDYLDKKITVARKYIEQVDEVSNIRLKSESDYLIKRMDSQNHDLEKRINSLEADRLIDERWLTWLTIFLIIALTIPFVMLSFFI